MPKLTRYTRQFAPTSLVDTRRATAGSAGEGLIQAGEAIGEFGDFLKEKQEKDANAWVDQAMANHRLSQTKRLAELQQNAEAGAPRFTENYLQELEQTHQQMLNYDGLTKNARRRLEGELTNFTASSAARTIAFEAKASASKQKFDFLQANDERRETLVTDPTQYAEVLEESRVAAKNALSGLDPVVRQQVILEEEHKLGLAAFDGALAQASTPDAARRLEQHLQDDKSPWKDMLDAEAFSRAKKRAEANVVTQQARQRQEEATLRAERARSNSKTYLDLKIRQAKGDDITADLDNFEESLNSDDAQGWSQLAMLTIGEITAEKTATAATLLGAIDDAATQGDAAQLQSYREQAEAMRDNGEIDDNTYLRATISTNNGLTGAIKLEQQVLAVEQAIQNNTKLDNTNKDHVDAVDEFYKTHAQSEEFENMTYQDRVLFEQEIVKGTNIIPPSLMSGIKSGLASDDPTVAIEAAHRLDGLMNLGPTVEAQTGLIDQDTLGYANELVRISRSSSDAQKAFEMVNDLRTTIDPVRVEARRSAFRSQIRTADGISGKDYLEENPGVSSGWTDADPVVAAEYAAEIENLAELQYARQAVPDIDAAYEYASKMLHRSWGVTEVGVSGRRFMKYPPEKFYGVEDGGEKDASWIKQQLDKELDLKRNDFDFGQLPENFKETLDLIPHPRLRNKQGKPVYMIQYREPSGAIGVLPWTWNPDFGVSTRKLAQDKVIREKELLAREHRSRIDAQMQFIEQRQQHEIEPRGGA